MPDEFTPKAPIALAKPGQIHGYGTVIRKDELHGDYARAATLAYANPGVPVIVHEWKVPADDDKRKTLYRYMAEEVQRTRPLMNGADAAGDLVIDQTASTKLPAPIAGTERFQVSLTARDPEAWRTFIVFWPQGRPVRAPRRSKVDERFDGADDDTEHGVEAFGQDPHLTTEAPDPGDPVLEQQLRDLDQKLAEGGEPVVVEP